MAIQFSVAVRNARADAVETAIGATTVTLEIRSGAAPANCATADSGTLIATIPLPNDWLTAASAGAKAKNGTWTVAAAAAGVIGHFRIKGNGVCGMQGSCSASGGGGDMIVDNVNAAVGQNVTVTAAGWTEPHA